MGSSLSLSKQVISLEGVPNARELGGYEMSDGRHVRRGCLLRCGALSKATDRDLDTLRSFGIEYIFDYRTEIELKHHPDRIIDGVGYISLPCIDPETDKMLGSQFSTIVGKPDFQDLLAKYSFTDEAKQISNDMYRSLVLSEYTQLQYSTFLNYAARSDIGPILWHCSQGKDRTGLGAAFLLSALGADRELVIEDFDLSNMFYKTQIDYVISKIEEQGGDEPEFDVARTLLGANTRLFVEALEIIDSHYGSMHQYLKDQLCLTDSEISTLKNKYLV